MALKTIALKTIAFKTGAFDASAINSPLQIATTYGGVLVHAIAVACIFLYTNSLGSPNDNPPTQLIPE
jgi:hypothetical protein